MSNKLTVGQRRLLEQVRQFHYKQVTEIRTDLLYDYNICPYCGTIRMLASTEVPEESNPILRLNMSSKHCVYCAEDGTMAQRYPEITAWVKQVIDAQALFRTLEEVAESAEKSSAAEPPREENPSDENPGSEDEYIN